MKIFEITNAQDQLALLRIIIDNTWAAIAKQAEEQRKANAKLMPRKRKANTGKAIKVPIPAPPSPKPKVAIPQPTPQPDAQPPTAQPYYGAVSRLNNASFGAKSHTFSGDNDV